MKYLLHGLYATLFTFIFMVGCASRSSDNIVVKKQPISVAKPIQEVKHTTTKKALPRPPQKEIKLKEVEDTNYTDDYMYPEDGKAAKKDPIERQKVVASTNGGMTKEACIAMISQEKFDKYTAMFGSEEASIKRCAMLKAMNK